MTPASLPQLITDTVLNPDFRRATFGGAVRGTPTEWVRVVLRPVELRGQLHLQFSYFDGKKDFAKNFTRPEAEAPLAELFQLGYAGIHLETAREEIDIRTTKRGKVFVGRKQTKEHVAAAEPHNRVKDVPLPEGRADKLLHVMGIATADGRVRPTMRAKFTQINEFLKHLTHSLDDAGFGRGGTGFQPVQAQEHRLEAGATPELRSLGRPLDILDCGCGSSYLTLAAHHYLNDVLAIPARIIGVDVNEELIRKSTERAEKLGTVGLNFACGRIGSLDAKPDIVLALHACDTATDDAIAQTILSGAKLLLSVPCCHHHLNDSIRSEGSAEVLRPILRHGILQQRTADLITDAFRALVLRIMGYRTEVVEFVSPEHTARNLMIRAIAGLPIGEPAFVNEYREMKRFWNVTPYLETLLRSSHAWPV